MNPMRERPGIWVYNYDFEFELAGETVQRKGGGRFYPWYFLNRSWHVMIPFAGPQDEVLVYEQPHPALLEGLYKKTGRFPGFLKMDCKQESNSIFSDLESGASCISFSEGKCVRPWGWSPKAVAMGENTGALQPGEIDNEVMRRINSKTDFHQLRNVCLAPDTLISGMVIFDGDSVPERLEETVADFLKQNGPSLIKHPFGTAGRLSDRCMGSPISARKIRNWQNWIRRSGSLLVEKSVAIRQEWSIQLFIEPGGILNPIALTRLYSSSNGNYAGTMVVEEDQHLLDDRIAILGPLMAEILKSGYTGPLGIDLIETPDGSLKALEINGRYTMGRVAAEWHRLLSGFPASFFTNLFVRIEQKQNPSFLIERIEQLLKQLKLETTLLNLVLEANTAMISLLVQGDKPESLSAIPDRLKSCLNTEFAQV